MRHEEGLHLILSDAPLIHPSLGLVQQSQHLLVASPSMHVAVLIIGECLDDTPENSVLEQGGYRLLGFQVCIKYLQKIDGQT